MASAALHERRTRIDVPRDWPVLAIALLAFVCVAINPVGYIGAGADDGRYLDAARCWVANGWPCLPTTHWWTRWPTIAPLALSIGIFGESRAAVGLGPLFYWSGAIVLAGWIGARWFGRSAGFIAAAILTVTPSFTSLALQPSADVAELTLQLAAVASATRAYERQSRFWAFAAGLAAGLALQARDTSLLFCGASALAWLALPRYRRGVLVWAVAGLASAMLGEVAVYAVATGDPLWRYKLALGHVPRRSTRGPRRSSIPTISRVGNGNSASMSPGRSIPG